MSANVSSEDTQLLPLPLANSLTEESVLSDGLQYSRCPYQVGESSRESGSKHPQSYQGGKDVNVLQNT